MIEKWKDVVGYEGLYKISNFGRVKGKHRIKSQLDNGKGYLIVHLYKNGKPRWHLVHRLVAKAFIENTENKPTVNHIDGNRKNNKSTNLEWATYSENNLHSYQYNGKKPPRAKAIYCVETGEVYRSSYEASRRTGFVQTSINKCVNGRQKTVGGTHWNLLINRKEKIYV